MICTNMGGMHGTAGVYHGMGVINDQSLWLGVQFYACLVTDLLLNSPVHEISYIDLFLQYY